MQEQTLLKIGLCTCTIGLIVLFAILMFRFEKLDDTPTLNNNIYTITGKIIHTQAHESFTTVDVQYLTTQRFVAFENISLQDECFNGIIERSGEDNIIRKIRRCRT